MNSSTVITEVKDNILFVKLNRPEKRNAMNDETILAIEDAFLILEALFYLLIFAIKLF